MKAIVSIISQSPNHIKMETIKELPENLEARLEIERQACWKHDVLLPNRVHVYLSVALSLDGLGYETGHHLATALAYQARTRHLRRYAVH